MVYTNYRHGDDWGMVYYCHTHINQSTHLWFLLQFVTCTAPVPRLSATTMANLAARRRACFRAPAPTTQRPSWACHWNLSFFWDYTRRVSTYINISCISMRIVNLNKLWSYIYLCMHTYQCMYIYICMYRYIHFYTWRLYCIMMHVS